MAGSYIAIVDFGSQTTLLIARRIREMSVMARIVPAHISAQALRDDPPCALILSGGPESLLEENSPRLDPEIFALNLPTLGICYGMQLLVDSFGGQVKKAQWAEFGQRSVEMCAPSALFIDVPSSLNVWMSHCDQTDLSGTDFVTLAKSKTCPHVAIASPTRKIFGVQFHPEVSHTEYGEAVLKNFIFTIAEAKPNFAIGDFLAKQTTEIKERVGDAHVIMGVSGGVDSLVAALIIHRAIHDRLHCVYVNHGLHRQGEIEEISSIFRKNFDIDLVIVDAQEQFFSALCGVIEPEIKRKNIGRVFVDVFEKEAQRYSHVKFLGQGTLYSDVIESSTKRHGPSHVIKSHHNVGGLPENMNLQLLEPLRELFKDEVRKVGKMLMLDEDLLMRQPFPGPAMAVRIPGEVTREKVELLRKADVIVREEIEQAYRNKVLPKKLWQWFAILLPVKSVGVMGDARTYGETIVIRCVESCDAMTADWAKIPHEILAQMSTRITNEVQGISRVLYDITQKPPGTIEWE